MLDLKPNPTPGISWPPEAVTALREGLGLRHPMSRGVTHLWITGSFLEAQNLGMFEVNPKFQGDFEGLQLADLPLNPESRPGNCIPFPGNFQSQSGW